MSILDDIQQAVHEAFLDDPDETPFRPAVLTKSRSVGGSVLTGGGVVGDDHAIRVVASNYNDRTRVYLEIPDGYIKILVLQVNDLAETITVDLGDVITTTDKLPGTWVVVDAKLDPAEAVWTVQGRPAQED